LAGLGGESDAGHRINYSAGLEFSCKQGKIGLGS
jgi:hypothetical protein